MHYHLRVDVVTADESFGKCTMYPFNIIINQLLLELGYS